MYRRADRTSTPYDVELSAVPTSLRKVRMELSVLEDAGRESPDDDAPLERWAPVGSSEIDDAWDDHDSCSLSEFERLRHLEEEQEQLNSSLVALTTHFAQVQFRLKQIVNASQEEKEVLLKELEEFAFRGIPDLRSYQTGVGILLSETEQEQEEKLEQQRQKQKELIEQLKEQLEDLEKYAFETGEAGMPSSMVLERQTVIIEHLKEKLPLNLDELDLLDPDDLRKQIDQAVREERARTENLGAPAIVRYMERWTSSTRKLRASATLPRESTRTNFGGLTKRARRPNTRFSGAC